MAMGATAERAVQVASVLSINCGGGVDTLTPGKPTKARKPRKT
jgi:hypothetical protein